MNEVCECVASFLAGQEERQGLDVTNGAARRLKPASWEPPSSLLAVSLSLLVGQGEEERPQPQPRKGAVEARRSRRVLSWAILK